MRSSLLALAAIAACGGCPLNQAPSDAGASDGGPHDAGATDGGAAGDAGCPAADAGDVPCAIDGGSDDGGVCESSRVATALRMDELARPLKGPCTRDDECVVLDPFPLSCGDGFVLAEICPYGLLAANLCELETRLAPLRAEGCQACARFGCTGDHVAFDCGTPLPHCIDGVCAP